MSEIQKNLFRQKAKENEGPMGPPPLRPRPSSSRKSAHIPGTWDQYFAQKFMVPVDDFHVNVYFSPPKGSKAPVFVFNHGAGSSGLTFSLVSAAIRQSMASANPDEVAGVLAYDMRGHGDSEKSADDDFSLDRLCDDLLQVIEQVWLKMAWQDSDVSPPVVLVGHSLGGAIVSRAPHIKKINGMVGVVVMDIVEGLSLEALRAMNTVLASWPPQFDSLSSAIGWHLSSRTLRNPESASVSVPVLFNQQSGAYVWKMDLKKTEPFWQQWFEGLSQRFLTVPGARMLVLAGTDRLDKELMIGQMQGKYQLVVFPESGHFIQEDEPDRTASALVEFWVRNGRPQEFKPVFGKFRN